MPSLFQTVSKGYFQDSSFFNIPSGTSVFHLHPWEEKDLKTIIAGHQETPTLRTEQHRGVSSPWPALGSRVVVPQVFCLQEAFTLSQTLSLTLKPTLSNPIFLSLTCFISFPLLIYLSLLTMFLTLTLSLSPAHSLSNPLSLSLPLFLYLYLAQEDHLPQPA